MFLWGRDALMEQESIYRQGCTDGVGMFLLVRDIPMGQGCSGEAELL